jgi:hypothetical protein
MLQYSRDVASALKVDVLRQAEEEKAIQVRAAVHVSWRGKMKVRNTSRGLEHVHNMIDLCAGDISLLNPRECCDSRSKRLRSDFQTRTSCVYVCFHTSVHTCIYYQMWCIYVCVNIQTHTHTHTHTHTTTGRQSEGSRESKGSPGQVRS